VRVLRRDLPEVGGEVTVPEERHALAERRRAREHLLDPPLLQLPDLQALLLRRLIATGEDRRLRERRVDQSIDGLRISLALRLVELGLRRAERRAAQQMRDARGLTRKRRNPVESFFVAERPGDRDGRERRLVREREEPRCRDAEARRGRSRKNCPPGQD